MDTAKRSCGLSTVFKETSLQHPACGPIVAERDGSIAIQRGDCCAKYCFKRIPGSSASSVQLGALSRGLEPPSARVSKSARGRQRSTAGEVVAPLVRLPVRLTRECDGLERAGMSAGPLRRRAVKHRRGLKLFERNAQAAPLDPPKSKGCEAGHCALVDRLSTSRGAKRHAKAAARSAPANPPGTTPGDRLTIEERWIYLAGAS